VQEVYDKKVLYRLVGVQPRATVTQDEPQLSDIVHSKGGGASVVQSVWEPAERSQETDDEGHARRTVLPREVIEVDGDEESRYEITRRKRRKRKEVVDGETIFTGDEGSEEEEGGEEGGQLPVKINRKREFWASKAGTGAGLGT
jgi:hypothetical protein